HSVTRAQASLRGPPRAVVSSRAVLSAIGTTGTSQARPRGSSTGRAPPVQRRDAGSTSALGVQDTEGPRRAGLRVAQERTSVPVQPLDIAKLRRHSVTPAQATGTYARLTNLAPGLITS